ncbi:MAG: M20/M25/M40 family metallo-hydrolase [Synergistaceae bacterium]|jgi:arginine utilization protein RocB|nr:M20/M25/M40 family metallo-hydrolase [Synergistaceae bacterium]
MISTPESREKLLVDLVRIPSVTSSPYENDAAVFVFDRLSGLDYFKKNPSHLSMISTPLEGDESRPLHSVAARMMAPAATKKTVVFVAHYDVVNVDVYGELAEYAFEPYELAMRLDPDELPERAAHDLLSGDYLFGRGIMDMKCGLALEMELLRDYDADRKLFDVNVILLAVPDEENNNCGMRGAVRYLADLKNSEGLEYIAGIDTEPGDPGLPDAKNQLVFLGALGKMLPAFYCAGIEAHVGNYYRGLSSALLSSQIVCAAEASPALADPVRGVCYPSWICLENRIISEGYSVTVPKKSITYFNCFVARKSPADVVEDMKRVANEAAERAVRQIEESRGELSRMGCSSNVILDSPVRVITYSELLTMAEAAFGGGAQDLRRHISGLVRQFGAVDIRSKGVAIIDEIAKVSGIKPPFIAVGFLPPYIPQRSSMNNYPLLRAVDRMIVYAFEKYRVAIDKAEFFAGLCDLSFMGFSGNMDDARVFNDNCPASGELYVVPFEEMTEIDMPVVNLSTCGYDAHRMTERLEKNYSLKILPELIAFTVNALSEEYDKFISMPRTQGNRLA